MSNHIYLKVPFCKECRRYSPPEEGGWHCGHCLDSHHWGDVEPDDPCHRLPEVPWEWVEEQEEEDD